MLPALLCGLILLASGCRVNAPKIKINPDVHPSEDVAVNSEQMRLIMRASVQPMSGIIVQAADRVFANTTDRRIKRNALLWKIEGVSALRQALFQPDPVNAVVDTWVFSWQMINYFQTGPGKTDFGAQQAVALSACQHLESEINQLATTFTKSGDLSKVRALVQAEAAQYPIEISIASRESILSHVNSRDVATSFSVREAVGTISVTVEDLNRRIEIYSAQLLDQSRWEAELLVMDMGENYQLDKALPLAQSAVGSAGRAVDTFDHLAPQLERTLATVEKAPDLVDRERQALVKDMSGLMEVQVSALLDRQRDAAIKAVSAEMRDIIAQEHKALMQDIEQAGERIVDHAFHQAIILILVTCGAVLLAALLYQFLRKRPQAD
jgi:hypothetical protein